MIDWELGMFSRELKKFWPGDEVHVSWTDDIYGFVKKESSFIVAKATLVYPFDERNYHNTIIEDFYGEMYDIDMVDVQLLRPAIVPWQIGFVLRVTLDFSRLDFVPTKQEREILDGQITLVPGLEPNKWSLFEADESYEGDGVDDLKEISLEAVHQGRILSAPLEYYEAALVAANNSKATPSAQFESDSEDWEALSNLDKIFYHLEAASFFGQGNTEVEA